MSLSKRLLIVFALFGFALVSCTDYASQIDSRYGDVDWDSEGKNISEKSSSSGVNWNVGIVSSSSQSFGVFVDTRNGMVYKTIEVGEKVWMAQNLNFMTTNSFCYNNNAFLCAKYGRLYTWDAAQTACPAGWHLSTWAEWDALKIAAYCDNVGWGNALKSTEWSKDASNCVGFGALPAGTGNGSFFEGEGLWTEFWTDRGEDLYADCFHLYSGAGMDNEVRRVNSLLSVRCVRD